MLMADHEWCLHTGIQGTLYRSKFFGLSAFPKEWAPKPDGLMKQTFLAWVLKLSTGQRVKWHMSVSLAEFPISSVLVARGVLYFDTPFRHTYPELGVWNY